MKPQRLAILALAALAAALIAAVALLVVEWGEPAAPPGPPPETVTAVPIPGSENPVIDSDYEQTQSERPDGIDAHEDARDETPPGVDEEDVERIEESRPAGIGPPQPVGGAQLLSCPQQLVRNHSARATGSTVSMVVVHYTVSAPGTLDVIQNLFNTSSFAASSHIGLELSGRCEQWVDYDRKAWTQGAFNSVSDSVEIIARGSEPRSVWLDSPIIKRGLLASWIVDRLRARGLRPRFVNPEGCTPLAGWTDHDSLECGNSHTDVQPHFPYDVVRRQVVAQFAGERVAVWRVSSGGIVLRQFRVDRRGYDRLLAWMQDADRGRPKVSRAERRNGEVVIRKVTVRVR